MANKRLPNVQLENVRILWPNFSGAEDRYNQEGKRNFNIELPEEVALQMIEDGWNVRQRPPHDEEDQSQYTLKVEVSYRKYKPRVLMLSGKKKVALDEDGLGVLDMTTITNADMILSPSYWEVNGNSGYKAYLYALYVTVEQNNLELKYADFED